MSLIVYICLLLSITVVCIINEVAQDSMVMHVMHICVDINECGIMGEWRER